MDIDSTIQAANIAYPSDAQLMVKMTLLVNKVWTYMKEYVTFFADFIPTVDVKAVKAKAKAYWFRDRQNTHATPSLWPDLWHESLTQISHVRTYFKLLLDDDLDRMPWNIRRAFDQVNAYCADLFLHVANFLCRGVMVARQGRIVSCQGGELLQQGQARQGAAIRACLPVGPHRGQLPLGRSVYLGADGRQSLSPSHDQRASGGVRPRRVGLMWYG